MTTLINISSCFLQNTAAGVLRFAPLPPPPRASSATIESQFQMLVLTEDEADVVYSHAQELASIFQVLSKGKVKVCVRRSVLG